MEDKTALSVPRLHPIAFQSVVISLGHVMQGFSLSHLTKSAFFVP